MSCGVEQKKRLLTSIVRHPGESTFCAPPFLGPLLFDNTDSDARDHCANERSMIYETHNEFRSTDALLMYYSIPLISSTLNLYDYRQCSNSYVFPPEIPTHTIRAADGETSRYHILAPEPGVFGDWVRELYEDGK